MTTPIYGGMLGPRGGLEQLMFTTAEPVARTGSRLVKRQALSGVESAAILPERARQWSCKIDHDAPQEGHIIDQLEAYQWESARTLYWLPADALGTNMLDPRASLMDMRRWTDMTPGGARVLPFEHESPRFLSSGSTRTDGTWAHLSDIPVPHSRTVTASAYVTAYSGDVGRFWLDELGIDGSTLRVHKQEVPGSPGRVLDRLSFTFETLPNTTALTFGFARCATVAAPALTLTDDEPRPWGVGRGCMSAVVEVTGREPLWTASGHPIYGAADATSFTITEVIR